MLVKIISLTDITSTTSATTVTQETTATQETTVTQKPVATQETIATQETTATSSTPGLFRMRKKTFDAHCSHDHTLESEIYTERLYDLIQWYRYRTCIFCKSNT